MIPQSLPICKSTLGLPWPKSENLIFFLDIVFFMKSNKNFRKLFDLNFGLKKLKILHSISLVLLFLQTFEDLETLMKGNLLCKR